MQKEKNRKTNKEIHKETNEIIKKEIPGKVYLKEEKKTTGTTKGSPKGFSSFFFFSLVMAYTAKRTVESKN